MLRYGRAWAGGQDMAVEPGARRADGARHYRAASPRPAQGWSMSPCASNTNRAGTPARPIPEPVKLECGPGEPTLGDWSRLGALAHYSGGAWYRKTVALSAAQTGGRVMLQLGRVAATAEVHVNGRLAGIRVAPPWTMDITKFVRPGENRCRDPGLQYPGQPLRHDTDALSRVGGVRAAGAGVYRNFAASGPRKEKIP